MRAKKSMREVIVKIPKRMLNENEHTVVHSEHEGFVYISTKRYETDYKSEAIREAMMKGYVEMSQINLKIASECLHVEFEAQHTTVERLVSGG